MNTLMFRNKPVDPVLGLSVAMGNGNDFNAVF